MCIKEMLERVSAPLRSFEKNINQKVDNSYSQVTCSGRMRHDARLNYTTAGFQKGRALPFFSHIINTSAGGLDSGQSKE